MTNLQDRSPERISAFLNTRDNVAINQSSFRVLKSRTPLRSQLYKKFKTMLKNNS